jgi:WD40 repeat protein
MKRRYLAIFTIGLAIVFGFRYSAAQTLSIFDIDSKEFPKMKAKIFALDSRGEQLPDIKKEMFKISEDGTDRVVGDLTCPIAKPPAALSSVLTIDVSGSMSGEGAQIAKTAANAWVDALALGKSECALTTFDTENYLNCDFSTDRNKLKIAISKISPQGGTDFNAALINKMFGALLVAEKGKNSRVVVFLTDGYASGDEEAIVAKAKSLNCKIYCVVLGAKITPLLENIAKRTGGAYFDDIRASDQAENAYRNILNQAQGGEACSIEWTSMGCPQDRILEFSLPSYSLSAKTKYSVDLTKLPAASLSPAGLRFGGLEPGSYDTKKITIASNSNALKLDSLTSNNPRFRAMNFPKGGMILNKGESFELKIQFMPFDSAYQFAKFTFYGELCVGDYFYVSGGYKGKNTLNIVEPNGFEKYAFGADTVVKWEGIPAADTVKIEFSSDAGLTWRTIAKSATGLKQAISMANVNSTKCLIRIKQLESVGLSESYYRGFTYSVDQISISPDSKYIAAVGGERIFKIFDLASGALIKSGTSVYQYKKCIFSPDGSKLALALSDYSVEILSAPSWGLINSLSGESYWVDGMAFSADGTKIALFDQNSKIRIVNLNDNSKKYTSEVQGGIQSIVGFKKSDKLAITSNNGFIELFNFNDASLIKQLGDRRVYTSIAISPDESRLITSDADYNIYVYDLDKYKQVYTARLNLDHITSMSWNPDASSIAISDSKGAILMISGETYDSLNIFKGDGFAINDIEWSPDGKYLASACNDNKIKLKAFELIWQEAISEEFWSIVEPKYATKDLDFGKRITPSSMDSTLTGFISNSSDVELSVNSIKMIGADTSAFYLVRGAAPFTIGAKSSANIEIRFAPQKVGNYQAGLEIVINKDTVYSQIKGEAYKPDVLIANKYFDFGEVSTMSFVDTMITVIKNKGSKSLSFDKAIIKGPDTEHFVLLSPIDYYTVQPEDSLVLAVKFAPDERGLVNSTIELHKAESEETYLIQLIGTGASNCGSESVSMSEFAENKRIRLIGNALIDENKRLILTKSLENQLGGIYTKNRAPIDSGFTVSFSFAMRKPYNNNDFEKTYIGADGLSFIIQNDGDTVVGEGGSKLAYAGLKNAMAIEYDLYPNDKDYTDDNRDPNGNHVAIMIKESPDSKLSAAHNSKNTLAMNSGIFEIRSDSTIYYSKIEYSPINKTFMVYLDSTGNFLAPIISLHDFDLKKYVNLEFDRGAYLGVFASCGSSFQEHTLTSFKLCTNINSTKVPSEVEDAPLVAPAIIFPNPVSGDDAKIIIKGEDFGEIIYMTIYNSLGERATETIKIENRAAKEIRCQAPRIDAHGAFFLKLESENKSFILPFIKK